MLSYISRSKFIQQNNFIPQPSILLSPRLSGKLGQEAALLASGENLTEERFAKSRQKKQRLLRVVQPFPADANFVPGGNLL